MRTPLTRTAAAAIGALLMLWVALPLTALAATAKNVPNGEEAWFLANKEPLAELPEGDPTCELPTGCNVSGNVNRQNPHPEGVLVVAANAGEPDAQMFINFDTSKLPFDAVITGGLVTLPVARDPDARNVNEAAADMVACRSLGYIPGGTDAGSYKDRPKVDEKTCVPVKQAKADPLIYTVDLERFGKIWSADPLKMFGISLMVNPEISPPAPDETWRVAFNTQRRSDQMTKAEEDKPGEPQLEYPAITSTLEYRIEKLSFPTPTGGSTSSGGGGGNVFPPPESSSGGDEDFSSGEDTSVASSGGSTDFGSSGSPSTGSGVIDAPADSGAAPVDQPVTAAAPSEAAAPPVAAGPTTPVSAPGPSPAVWVMPVLAVLMAAAMAWSLVQPVELAGEREGAVSRLMRTRRLTAENPSAPS